MDTIEYVLGRNGNTLLLPMDGTDIPNKLRATLRFNTNGDDANGVLSEQVNAIFLVRDVHATGHGFYPRTCT